MPCPWLTIWPQILSYQWNLSYMCVTGYGWINTNLLYFIPSFLLSSFFALYIKKALLSADAILGVILLCSGDIKKGDLVPAVLELQAPREYFRKTEQCAQRQLTQVSFLGSKKCQTVKHGCRAESEGEDEREGPAYSGCSPIRILNPKWWNDLPKATQAFSQTPNSTLFRNTTLPPNTYFQLCPDFASTLVSLLFWEPHSFAEISIMTTPYS